MNALRLGELAESSEWAGETCPKWCPGCGHFGALTALERALMVLRRRTHDVALVSGSGCAAHVPCYLDAYGMHGTHGGALPMAIGLKLARPEIAVIAVTGDGDAYGAGANHLLQACRANADLVCVVLNNRVLGASGGRPSPTAERAAWDRADGARATRPLNPLVLAITAGASFVARGFTGDPSGLARIIRDAVEWPGIALIDVLSPCVTYRREALDWKDQVYQAVAQPFADIPAATRALLEDGGFGLGVWYRGEMAVRRPRPAAVATLEDVERELLR